MKMTKLNKALKISLLLLSSAALTSCYQWWENKIEMNTEDSYTSLSDFLYEEQEVTALSSPTQLIASQGLYSGSIKIHWNDVPYAKSYRIERAVIKPDSNGNYSEPEEGDFEVLGKYVYSTTYTDTILSSPGTSNDEYNYKYYYRVCAENLVKGLESSDFTDFSQDATKGEGWLLPPPGNIEAWKGKSTEYIEIDWDSVDNATSYLIYRGEKSTGLGMELLSTVSGNKNYFLNEMSDSEKGTEFYYKVCAVLSNGSQSAFTGLALGYSLKEGAPNYPSDITVTNGKGTDLKNLSVSWSAVNVESGYSVKYAVYRSSSEESVYSLLSSSVSGTSYTDTSLLKTGIEYYYYVQTIKVNDSDSTDTSKSAFSEKSDDATGWLLSAPTSYEVSDSSNSGKSIVKWTPAVGYSVTAYNYNIYSGSSQDGTFELIKTVNLADLTLDDDGYYQTEVDKINFYKITTINAATSAESDFSGIFAPTPSAPQNVTASKTSDLGNIENYTPNSNEVYPVKITWSAPANETPYGYNIYRSTKTSSSFRKLNDSPITDSFTYYDENETARAGTYYYYKVVSLNELGQGKNSNNPADGTTDARGYGAITREQWFREYNKTVKSSQAKLTLMHKSGNTAKLGQESTNGTISGTLSYDASVSGTSGVVVMTYTNYADFYINNDSSLGVYVCITGNTNTKAGIDTNGNMYGTVNITGMYPGTADYGNLEIKSGAAGGGYYAVETKDLNGNTILSQDKVDWLIGEE